jgi:hypothetical protein
MSADAKDESPAESALAIWKRKLDFLLTQQPTTTDAEQKFALQEKITEARAKIQDLNDEADETDDIKPPPPVASTPDRPGSPFLVGRAIEHDDDFYGRHAQRDLLQDAIQTGQSVQVLGERRMGKTSLLHWVKRHALTWQDRPVVWISAQGLPGRSPSALVQAVAEGLGRREEVAKALDQDNAAVVMSRLLPVVLLVDEAAVLARDGHGFDADFLGVLRDFCEQRQLVWVSASVVDLMGLFQDTGLASDFLNNARTVRVGQLEDEASRELASRLDDEVVAERVWEQASGFAYGLQWLGDCLWRQPGDQEAACFA